MYLDKRGTDLLKMIDGLIEAFDGRRGIISKEGSWHGEIKMLLYAIQHVVYGSRKIRVLAAHGSQLSVIGQITHHLFICLKNVWMIKTK